MNNIKKEMELQNILQGEMCKHLGISERSFQYIKNGKQLPNVETAYQIAKYLKVSIIYLFNLD